MSEDSSEWVNDSELDGLVSAERALKPDESEEDLARRLMRENLPQVTLGIIHTALHGSSDRVRLDAQKYVVERVLGRVGDDAYGDEVSPLDAFLNKVNQHANQGH